VEGSKELWLAKEDGAYLWEVDVVKSEVEHGDECLLHTGLVVAVVCQDVAETAWSDRLEDHWEELGVQLTNVAQCNGC